MSELYWLNPFFEAPKPEPILREAFAWEDNGIFVAIKNAALQKQIELPWGNTDEETLDLAYFGNHSGGKFCSPLVKLILQTDSLVDEDGRINSTGAIKIANILLRKYYTNWKSLWATNVASYNPLHNYDVTENRNLKKADSESEFVAEERRQTGTGTTSYGKVDTTNHGRTVTETDSRYGVNTTDSDPKPSDKIETVEGGDTVTTFSGSDTDTRNYKDNRDSSKSKAGAGEEEEEIHRAGNIGVTTTQKLIEEERALWLWNYFDQVFSDVDRELALSFYDPCRV